MATKYKITKELFKEIIYYNKKIITLKFKLNCSIIAYNNVTQSGGVLLNI